MNPGEHKRIVSVIRVKLHTTSLLCVLDKIGASVSGDSEATDTGEE